MKYANRYRNVADATAARGNYSPNISYVEGSSNRSKLVLTDCGVDKEIEFEASGSQVTGIRFYNYLCFTAQLSGSSLYLYRNGSPYSASFQYSTDKKNWSSYSIGSTITLSNIGDKVYFRGDNPSGLNKDTWSNYYRFSLLGRIAASGNIMSLIDSSCESLTVPCNYCFAGLFRDCTSLTQAPALPATTLADYCYDGMFSGCTSLTQAPELPATTLTKYCYYCMFKDCTGLAQAPALLATTFANYCYSDMFSGCTSLTQAPELPATTLTNYCYYYMFFGCTSLTQAPELPATTLQSSCYNSMFSGCTSLTQAPELPATALANNCYSLMFYGCTSLTQAPILNIETIEHGSCQDMFKNSGILNAGNVKIQAPNMVYWSCIGMFSTCTQLSTPPTITTTNIDAHESMRGMFANCNSLTNLDVQFTNWGTDATTDWFENISSSGTFKCPAALDTTTRGASRVPSSWSVTH